MNDDEGCSNQWCDSEATGEWVENDHADGFAVCDDCRVILLKGKMGK